MQPIGTSTGAWLRLMLAGLTLALALGACQRGPDADEHAARAREYRDSGNLYGAVIEYKSALKLQPDRREARDALGRIYVTLGYSGAAVKELGRARELGARDKNTELAWLEALRLAGDSKGLLQASNATDSPVDEATRLAYRGFAEMIQRKLDAAEKSFDHALEIDPKNRQAMLGRATLLAATGQREKAEKAIAAARAAWPKEREITLVAARMALSMGDLEHAAKLLTAVIDETTKETSALTWIARQARFGLARVRLKQGRIDDADAQITELGKHLRNIPSLEHLRAVVAVNRGDIATARERLREALRLAPNHPGSLMLLAQLEINAGHLEQAHELVRRLLAVAPYSLAARKLGATVAMRMKRPDAAIEVLAPVARAGLADADALGLLAAAQMASGDFGAATDSLRHAVENFPDDKRYRLQLARTYFIAGDEEQAIPLLEQSVKVDRNFAQADYLLAMAQLKAGHLDKAREVALALRDKMPKNPIAENILGTIAAARGDEKEALAHFSAALKIAPDYITAALNTARLLEQRGDKAGASAAYEKALKSHPESLPALLAVARLSADAGDTERALALLRKARDTHPEAIEPRMVLASYHLQRRAPNRALELAKEALAIAPNDPRALRVAGEAALALGDAAQARKSFTGLAKARPRDAEVLHELGLSQMMAGDLDAARKSLQAALAIDPKKVSTQIALGRLELASRRPAGAIAIAEKLAQDDAARTPAMILLADAHLMDGDPAAAARALERIAPDAVDAQTALKLYAARRSAGQTARAQAGVREWAKRHGDQASAHLLLGHVALIERRTADAMEEYQRALDLQPDSVMALNNLASLYTSGGRTKDALALAKRAYDLAPESGLVLDTYGWLLLSGDDTERGVTMLRSAAKKLPNNRSVGYHLAAGLAKIGDVQGAKQRLEQVLAGDTPFPERAQASLLREQLALMQ